MMTDSWLKKKLHAKEKSQVGCVSLKYLGANYTSWLTETTLCY